MPQGRMTSSNCVASFQPQYADCARIPGRKTDALNVDGMPLWRACLSFRLNSSIESRHEWEGLMAAINLKGMDVDALLTLRADIDKRLSQKRSELEKQLSRLSAESGHAPGISRTVFGRGSALKGRKVAPKYRGPGGETWAGRGARPRWLAALIKQGRKLDEFAIDKALTARRGRREKKARRKKKVGQQSPGCGCVTLAFVGKGNSILCSK